MIYMIHPEYTERIRAKRALIMRGEFPEAARAQELPPYKLDKGVARISIKGMMEKDVYFFDEISTPHITNSVNAAVRDSRVRAIMLVLDTPGGSVDGLPELVDSVYEAQKIKPVIAQVDGMAASAGYWVASQASTIYAHRLDMVGSIGVRTVLYDYSEMFEKDGVEAVVIDTGEYKSAGVVGAEITKNQREDFRRIVDIYFNDFLSAIVRGRSMEEDQVKKIADGRVFIGDDAVKRGLVDGIQTFSETFNALVAINESATRGRTRTTATRLRLAEAKTR